MENKSIFCVMLDCSRNAVMKPEKVKEYISIVKDLGYNSVMLYLEDTYEVAGEPLFGYLRGRYTKEELKDIDCYAKSVGIELIPCVQTLAHLNTIFRWGEYSAINDNSDILLVGNERTYKLIENIFSTIKECFSSRLINVGLDEAHLLGRGKYQDVNGYNDRFNIFCDHLDKVVEIAKINGFTPIMWSDTFFNRSADNTPYSDLTVPETALKRLPKNVELVCWDYYHLNKDFYDNVLDAHKQFSNPIWYAGSAYASRGFAPCNAYSIKTLLPAMQSCRERNIKNVIITMWGGNGAECSLFATLPSLYYAKQVYDGNEDLDKIARQFNKITGEDFYALINLDLPNNVGVKDQNYGPSKYMLYNDPFFGIYDCTVNESDANIYGGYAKQLTEYGKTSKYGYVFDTLAKLCEVLKTKYSLGIRTRNAYAKKDKKALSLLLADYDITISGVENFYSAFKKQWYIDNKPNGFEVQDIRLGGLIMRLKNCKQRLLDYIEGKENALSELEQPLLDVSGSTEFSKKITVLNDWKTNVSVNII